MTTYSGICIGGPLAGQSKANLTRGFNVDVPRLRSIPTTMYHLTDVADTADYRVDTYRYIHMDKLAGAPVHLWVLADATLEDIVMELAANYKPKGGA